MVPGRYFDGKAARALPVELHHDAGLLIISGADFRRDVATADLRFADSHPPAPICIRLPEGGICEMDDGAQGRALLAEFGAPVSLQSRLRAHRTGLAALAVGFLCVLAATWRWGIPVAADLIVDHVPASWDRRIGDSVLQQLEDNDIFKPSTLPVDLQARLERRFDTLKKGAGAPQYRIVFRRLGVPNAFALPGGCIVVADEIVALAPQDDAALLTVLGHELGHLQERHGMRGIVRASLFSAVAAWYLGDISGVAAGAAAGFTSLSYSRGAEQSADRYALRLMHDNGISTRPAAELFRRLADLQPDRTAGSTVAPGRGAEMPEYLSTHSDVRGRIALFENEDTEPAAAAAAKPR